MAAPLAGRPFGPWRPSDSLTPGTASRGPDLAFSSHRAFAALYRELTRIGIPPPIAKVMEVWEAASALGVGFVDPEEPAFPAQQGAGAPGVSRSEMDLLRARVAAARGEGPPPQPSATNPAMVAAMMNAFTG